MPGLDPIIDLNGATDPVSEAASRGATVVTTAFAGDLDPGDRVTCSLTLLPGGRNTIHPTTGEVSLPVPPDHEAETAHPIKVRAVSTDGREPTRGFAIDLTNARDNAPTRRLPGAASAEDLISTRPDPSGLAVADRGQNVLTVPVLVDCGTLAGGDGADLDGDCDLDAILIWREPRSGVPRTQDRRVRSSWAI